MVTRRDIAVALITASATLGVVVALAETKAPEIMQSKTFDWNAIPETPTDAGSTRRFFQAPTATLDELEMHVTTLKPGIASHAPHRHPNEELVIIREGTLEAFVNGETKVVGPGSVLFFASNQPHGVRNIGTVPATYHVINWASKREAK